MLSIAQFVFFTILSLTFVCSFQFFAQRQIERLHTAPRCDVEIAGLVAMLYYGLLLFFLSVVSSLLYFICHIAICLFVIIYAVVNRSQFVQFVYELRLYLITTTAVITLAFFLFIPETVGHNIAVRIWPSVDNHLSLIASERYFQFGKHYLFNDLLPKVPITDRSLITFGFLDFSFWLPNPQLNHFIVAVALQMIWVIVLVNFYRRRGDTDRQQAVQLFLLLGAGLIWFYSVYTWYKILAAGIYFGAVVLACDLTDARKEGQNDETRELARVLIPPAILLCIVLHGSFIFAAAAFFLIFPRQCLNPKGLLISIAIALPLIILFVIQPPSGQMVKWHVFGESDAFDVNYAHLFHLKFGDAKEWLLFKMNNFVAMVLPYNWIVSTIRTRQGHDGFLVFLRYLQLFSLVLSPGILWGAMLFFKRSLFARYEQIFLSLLVVSLIVTNVGLYGGELHKSNSLAILHHRPFSEGLILAVLLAGFARRIEGWSLFAMVAATAIWFVLVWIPRKDVFGNATVFVNWPYLGLGIAITALLLWVFALRHTPKNSMVPRS